MLQKKQITNRECIIVFKHGNCHSVIMKREDLLKFTYSGLSKLRIVDIEEIISTVKNQIAVAGDYNYSNYHPFYSWKAIFEQENLLTQFFDFIQRSLTRYIVKIFSINKIDNICLNYNEQIINDKHNIMHLFNLLMEELKNLKMLETKYSALFSIIREASSSLKGSNLEERYANFIVTYPFSYISLDLNIVLLKELKYNIQKLKFKVFVPFQWESRKVHPLKYSKSRFPKIWNEGMIIEDDSKGQSKGCSIKTPHWPVALDLINHNNFFEKHGDVIPKIYLKKTKNVQRISFKFPNLHHTELFNKKIRKIVRLAAIHRKLEMIILDSPPVQHTLDKFLISFTQYKELKFIDFPSTIDAHLHVSKLANKVPKLQKLVLPRLITHENEYQEALKVLPNISSIEERDEFVLTVINLNQLSTIKHLDVSFHTTHVETFGLSVFMALPQLKTLRFKAIDNARIFLKGQNKLPPSLAELSLVLRTFNRVELLDEFSSALSELQELKIFRLMTDFYPNDLPDTTKLEQALKNHQVGFDEVALTLNVATPGLLAAIPKIKVSILSLRIEADNNLYTKAISYPPDLRVFELTMKNLHNFLGRNFIWCFRQLLNLEELTLFVTATGSSSASTVRYIFFVLSPLPKLKTITIENIGKGTFAISLQEKNQRQMLPALVRYKNITFY